MLLKIGEIRVKKGRRELNGVRVDEIADSIRQVGLLNPLTVDKKNVLIAGLHRLEAVKRLGWTEVECTMTDLEGLMAELAELDENFVRNGYSPIEHGEKLLRRKEIYEILHPETKAGIAQAVGMNRVLGNNVGEKFSSTSKSFVDDTAEKLGITPRTVRNRIQTAKRLTQEAKEVIRDKNMTINDRETRKLSRLEPEEQKKVAEMLAAGEIRNIGEYVRETQHTDTLQKKEEERAEAHEMPTEVEKHFAPRHKNDQLRAGETEEKEISIKEIAAELKDMDKDCSATPEIFLMEFGAFAEKFRQGIEWYRNPYFDEVYPRLSKEQAEELRELTDSICELAEGFYDEIEGRRVKNGKQ